MASQLVEFSLGTLVPAPTLLGQVSHGNLAQRMEVCGSAREAQLFLDGSLLYITSWVCSVLALGTMQRHLRTLAWFASPNQGQYSYYAHFRKMESERRRRPAPFPQLTLQPVSRGDRI